MIKKVLSFIITICMIVPLATSVMIHAVAAEFVGRTSLYSNNIRFFDNVTKTANASPNTYEITSGNTTYVLHSGPNSGYESVNSDKYGMKVTGIVQSGITGQPFSVQLKDGLTAASATKSYFSIRYKAMNTTTEGYATAAKSMQNGANSSYGLLKNLTLDIENGAWKTHTVKISDNLVNSEGEKYTSTNDLWPYTGQFLQINLPALEGAGAYYILDYVGIFDSLESAQLQSKVSDELWGIPQKPKTTVGTGTYFNSQIVELQAENNETIYYTTDGSTPNKNSNKYQNAITIEKNLSKPVELKAVCYANDKYGIETRSDVTSIKLTFSETRTSNNGDVLYFDNDQFPATSEKYGKILESNGTLDLGIWDLGAIGTFSMRYKAVGNVPISSNIAIVADGISKTVSVLDSTEWQIINVSASEYVQNGKSLEITFPTLSNSGYYIIDYVGIFADESAANKEALEQSEFWQCIEKRESIRNDTAVTYYGVQAKVSGAGVRFVGTLDDYQSDFYDKIGFEIRANGIKNKTPVEITKVYTSILAAEQQISADDGSTLFTFCVNDIPSNPETCIFTVCAYAIVDGVYTEGSEYMLIYNVKTNEIQEFKKMKYADEYFVQGLDEQFEDGKNAILDAASDYKVTGSGKTYYVSDSTGDDSNDGLSPEKAWKTLERVNSTSVNEGSVILFKRGDVWNRQGALKIKNGVTFSAYGSGEKPMVSNYIDASLASDWTKVGDNLYVYSGAYESGTPMDYQNNDVSADYPRNEALAGSYITSTNYDVISNDDIGNIIFNDGEGWGVKITKYNDSDKSVNLGISYTGFGTLTHNSKTFVNQNDLSQHLEFYHNPTESRLYLYCDGGNPSEVFRDIKIVLRGYLCGGEAKRGNIDNLAFKYAGCHGISIGEATDFTIQNCEIGWIGGSIQEYTFGGRTAPTRFGEGIQNWGNCDGFYIKNNYIYQIYDGATSSQQSVNPNLSSVLMTNAEVSGNCFEYNSASIEFWFNIVEEQADNDNFKLSNWNMSGNMIRRAGNGFGSTRPDDADSVLVNGTALHDSFGWPKPKCENIQFTDNTMWDNAGCILEGLGWNTKMFNMSDNIIVHEYGTIFGVLAKDFENIKQWDISNYMYTPDTIKLLLEKSIIGNNSFYFTKS